MTEETEQDTALQDDGIYQLSNGVRLKVEGVIAPLLLKDIATMAGGDEPRPPVVFVKTKEREEPNPDDPEYIAAHQFWVAETSIRLLRALATSLTKLDTHPAEMIGPESEEFEDIVLDSGLQLARSGSQRRYIQWLLYVALTEQKDIMNLGVVLMRQSGAREEDVAEAQELFRSGEERATDNGASPVGNRADRRRLQRESARSGPPDGGA